MSNFWGARFEELPDEFIQSYTSREDLELDTRLIEYDILNTMAHDLMLWKKGILKKDDLLKILSALNKLLKLHHSGKFKLKIAYEDVHLNIEEFVRKEAGEESGGMMHLARSRNDQVLTDLRMYLRDKINLASLHIIELANTFLEKAKNHTTTVMPGFTHTQHAQPITFSHWCLAYVDGFIRDLKRLSQLYERVNLSPLGAGAIAGVGWDIDRNMTAKLLGFYGVQENTLDVVSSRGELEAEISAILSLYMVRLSQIAEEAILWSTYEYNMIKLNDKFTTGSSIMPQKKNPDVCELIRAKASRVIGALVSMLAIKKALPSGYNRDYQELKSPLFYILDTVIDTTKIISGVIETLEVDEKRMKELSGAGFTTAVDLADLLIKKGVPFRTAYKIVGNVVKHAVKNGLEWKDITADTVSNAAKQFGYKISLTDEDIHNAMNPENAVARRCHLGGPAPSENMRMIKNRAQVLTEIKEEVNTRIKEVKDAFEKLKTEVRRILNEFSP
ncbi:MAG: argininosuccinate lyase [Candidatus Odinarchaeia archaeon]